MSGEQGFYELPHSFVTARQSLFLSSVVSEPNDFFEENLVYKFAEESGSLQSPIYIK